MSQVQPFEEPLHVSRKDLLRCLTGVQHEKHRDESLDDVRVAVCPKHHFGRLGAPDAHIVVTLCAACSFILSVIA